MSEFESVENQVQAALDDAVIQPEPETGDALETIAEEVPPEEPKDTPKEPGWIKQRVEKAVEKARKSWEAEQEAKLKPLYDNLYDRQAEELVRQGEFKSLERAKEYVRLKGGVDVTPSNTEDTKPEPQKRDAQGRFTGNNQPAEDPVVKARTDLLVKQVQRIRKETGVDLMAQFKDDETVKRNIASGKWDFYDVLDYAREQQAPKGKHIPTPVRSPNGASTGGLSIAGMSDAQFERLQQNLHNGKRYDARK